MFVARVVTVVRMTSPNVDICVENDDPKANNSNDDELNESACVLGPVMRQSSQLSDRVKRKSWYNAIYPSYKSRSDAFKKLFKEVPENQRLVVDYSCALQREILVHGRMYVSQHYMCFHANIFGWETSLCLKWKDIKSLSKEKTALVIPNAILFCTETDKYFITSFASRDKTYLMLFRIWQNALMNKEMLPQEVWACVHNSYGDLLGLTSDDEEDYIDPKEGKSAKWSKSATAIDAEKTNGDNGEHVHVSDAVEAVSTPQPPPRQMQTKLRQRKPSENIPTDVSNSTGSEDESMSFSSTAECTSMHEGRQLVHTILPINVDNLLTLLFSKSKFFAEFHNMRKTTNMVLREWVDGDDGTKKRTINFTVAVTQPVGPKSSNMTETQLMRDCSVSGQLYSIDIVSTNSGIPYADSFNIQTHYCLVRTVDDHTMLSVYAQIKYIKSVWGVVKGFIEKNVWNGLEDFYRALLKALQSEYCIPPAKSKSRRSKRALIQKATVDEASAKSKTNLKLVSVQSTSSTSALTNDAKSTCFQNAATETILPRDRDTTSSARFLSLNTFTILMMFLLLVLVLFNIYLLAELYAYKQKELDGITLGKMQLNSLISSSDPEELKAAWMKFVMQQKSDHETEMERLQNFLDMIREPLEKIKSINSNSNLNTVDDSIDDEF